MKFPLNFVPAYLRGMVNLFLVQDVNGFCTSATLRTGNRRKDRYYALYAEMYTTLLLLEQQIYCERIYIAPGGTS